MMEELGARGLGYLDDGSSNRSLAPQLADGNKVPFARADLMHRRQSVARNPSSQRLPALKPRRVENGHAIGIVSALPISVADRRRMGARPRSQGHHAGPRQRPDEIGACPCSHRARPRIPALSRLRRHRRVQPEGNVFIGRRKPDDDPEDSTRGARRPGRCRRAASTRARTRCEAALRELLRGNHHHARSSLLAEAPEWIYYDLPDEALGIALKGKYRGQRQRWFAFAFTGEDSEIDVTTPAAASIRPSSTPGAGKSSSRTARPDRAVQEGRL